MNKFYCYLSALTSIATMFAALILWVASPQSFAPIYLILVTVLALIALDRMDGELLMENIKRGKK